MVTHDFKQTVDLYSWLKDVLDSRSLIIFDADQPLMIKRVVHSTFTQPGRTADHRRYVKGQRKSSTFDLLCNQFTGEDLPGEPTRVITDEGFWQNF